MSINRLRPEDFETFTVETNPRQTYTSSSTGGITGSLYLFTHRSKVEKEIYPLSAFSRSAFVDQNLDEFRRDILRLSTKSNIADAVTTYLENVNAQQASVRKQQKLEIIRFTPPFTFKTNTVRKNHICNSLMDYYKVSYPRSHFNYANYHCFNFYTASNVPSDSVLLYPNPVRTGQTSLTDYGLTGSFSFDFWIRPKYTTENRDDSAVYTPGGILHLTSSYAITIHSGTHKDPNGRPDSFRLVLQLSNSADVAPESAPAAVGTDPFIFISNDNVLPKDEWSHVTIRWGGTNYSNGSGSFLINGNNCGNFTVTSSIAIGDQNSGNPSVLCLGNYYSGENFGLRSLDYFFTTDTAQREGLYELVADTGIAPTLYGFNHPLNAELHDIKIYEQYLNNDDVKVLGSSGPSTLITNLRFYVPPFFTEESPFRKYYGTDGGCLVTPFFSKDGYTKHPFSVDMAFSCGGHYINLENYVRDFATGRYARLWGLSASVINNTSQTPLAANTLLYNTGSIRKRLYTILPCDNGRFIPYFGLLNSLSGSTFINDHKIYEPGVISLRNMITASQPASIMSNSTGSIITELVGASPESVGSATANSLAIYHRLRDPDSNQVVIFDISNLFYGNAIKPNSFEITDTSLSGSNDKVSITIKDDGMGNLYRANASTKHATWASVGNIFYNEGIVIIKHPQLFFFGENQFEVKFQGTQNIHVLSVNAYARSFNLVSSSNPSFGTGSLDLESVANKVDNKYVWISHIHLLDDNLNVITRTACAQPIVKKASEALLFKLKIDF